MEAPPPIFELTRGEVVEAVHRGSIVVVASDGFLLRSHGDPYTVAFLRSSAKPFQVLPFVENGGVEHYRYTPAELALSCASHETSQMHLDAVCALQQKTGIEEAQLQCGPHLPGDAEKLREVVQKNIVPTPNFNNCSGKHTSMLAFAKMRGYSLEDYLSLAHPIQREILKALAGMCDMPEEKIQTGVDGCSAPNFAMPLFNAALGMARLCDPRDLDAKRATACKKIVAGMATHPEMVSNFGEFDCELMKIAKGKIVTKRGAEGYQIIGVMPGVVHERGVGVAFKVEDGDKSLMGNDLKTQTRVRPPATLEILRQLGALSEAQMKSLSMFGPEKILKNYAGLVTGKMRPVFEL
ncbi:MAG: L-asparaginase [Chloroflexi bacterium]|nr:asparaginase [Chloroflexi bacterium CFX1]MCK6566640.1 asparaginase [Anaerolineales bacterium]MCQ3953099.1 asparaginase [Chloroflexota bacterium]MDL1920067.1 asparaginase [Chloroflexi bacterium CFX5]NUQ58655.1 asparaginase [Anaerolineales bacterium]